jgi:hypothetical protein
MSGYLDHIFRHKSYLPFSLEWFHLWTPSRKSGIPYCQLNAPQVTFVIQCLHEILKPRCENGEEYQDSLKFKNECRASQPIKEQ